ncbi:MAG TPA: hypothetical protein PK095_21275, partial [Myxococcota bacterium]|nr:hypothetical protein [Myxococcota bacterium]
MDGQASSQTGLAIVLTMIIFIALLLIGAAASSSSRKRRRAERRVASQQRYLAPLQAHYGGTLEPGALRFAHRGSTVLVETLEGRTRLVIEGGLAPIGFGFEKIDIERDRALGDPDFDPVVNLTGDPVWALAVLTPATRKLIRGAVLAGFEMIHEPTPALSMSVAGHAEYIAPHISTGLALASALSPTEDLHTLLMRRLQDEPLPAIRESIALLLPSALVEAEDQLPVFCRHPDRAVRLALAHRLGHPTLWSTLPETDLIELLEAPMRRTRLHAMARLETHGTIAAVPALKKARDIDWQAPTANDAILAIQSRATGSR